MLCGCRCAMISANCMASTSHQSLPRTKCKGLANSNFLCPSPGARTPVIRGAWIVQTPTWPQARATSRRLVLWPLGPSVHLSPASEAVFFQLFSSNPTTALARFRVKA